MTEIDATYHAFLLYRMQCAQSEMRHCGTQEALDYVFSSLVADVCAAYNRAFPPVQIAHALEDAPEAAPAAQP